MNPVLAALTAALAVWCWRQHQRITFLRARVDEQNDRAMDQAVAHATDVRTHETEICRLMEANDELYVELQQLRQQRRAS